MHALDWVLFFGFLAYVIFDGVRRSRGNETAADVFLASRSAPWWVMGLSIMATQASAITMIGTTGKGWEEGLRFVQFYYALPLAMIILCFTLLPLYHRHRVFTAYEYLGLRFDRKTRILTSLVFLIQRGLAVGIVIYAPSVVLAALFGWSDSVCITVMGVVALTYTSLGGMKAVLSTDVKQMVVMTVGLFVALYCAIDQLPPDVGLGGAWKLADALERTTLADTTWNPSEKYTVWSSLIGGLFLFLGYFGCDQSQAQRYLSGRSLAHSRAALLMNAVLKVPFQLLVLTIGLLLFVGHLFQAPPVSFVPDEVVAAEAASVAVTDLRESAAEAHAKLSQEARSLVEGSGSPEALNAALVRSQAAREAVRAELVEIGDPASETNFVFPRFILDSLPIGLVGLLIAAIFAAALSSIDSELNALATVWVIDIERFAFGREASTGDVGESRRATFFLGVFATGCAFWFGVSGQAGRSVIEAVNQIGSYFYGSLLGVFVLAVGFKRANGDGAFAGVLAGVATVAVLDYWPTIRAMFGEPPGDGIGFLYLNTSATVATVTVGLLVSALSPAVATPSPDSPA